MYHVLRVRMRCARPARPAFCVRSLRSRSCITALPSLLFSSVATSVCCFVTAVNVILIPSPYITPLSQSYLNQLRV